jgi:hypothetical protein
MQLGDLDCVKHRATWRLCRVAHVAVPILPGTTHSHRTTSLGNVRNDDNLRVTWHAPALTKYIQFNLTEAAGECDLLWWSETLVAEEDDAVGVIGLFNLGKGRVVQGVGQIDTTDFGANGSSGRNNLDEHLLSSQPREISGVWRGDLSPLESVHQQS